MHPARDLTLHLADCRRTCKTRHELHVTHQTSHVTSHTSHFHTSKQHHKNSPASSELNSSLSFSAAAVPSALPALPIPTKSNREDSPPVTNCLKTEKGLVFCAKPVAAASSHAPAAGAVRSLRSGVTIRRERTHFRLVLVTHEAAPGHAVGRCSTVSCDGATKESGNRA